MIKKDLAPFKLNSELGGCLDEGSIRLETHVVGFFSKKQDSELGFHEVTTA